MILGTPSLGSIQALAAVAPLATTNIAGHEMVEIPCRPAVIGSEWFDDARPHWVAPEESFFISTKATSEGQYREVMDRAGREDAPEDHPVTEISYCDAVEYLKRRGGGLMLPPEGWWEIGARGFAVSIPRQMEDEWGRYRSSDVVDFVDGRFEHFVFEIGGTIYSNPRSKGFQRRIGTGRDFLGWHVFGSPSGRLTHDEVWYKGGGTESEDLSRKRTVPVGWGPESTFGLYNMSGNVLEWVLDWYSRHSYMLNMVTSGGPCRSAADFYYGNHVKVVRGGSWDGGPMSLRAGCREYLVPTSSVSTVGFRVGAPASAVK